jgi:hypothetical protein
VVELPPLTVSAATEELPWDYLEIPGFEILSRCEPAAVLRLAREVERLRQWLGVLLPEDLRFQSDVPTEIVLYDVKNRPEVSREVVADMMQAGRKSGGEGITYRSLPNMRLVDRDTMGFLFILDPDVFAPPDPDLAGDGGLTVIKQDVGSGNLKLKPEHVYYLAKNRAPALPGWFVDGVVDLFGTADFNRGRAVVLDPLVWLTPEETREIKRNPARRRKLPPLEELFSASRQTATDEALRRAEAMLFIRWGLDGRNQPRKEALWKFVRLASAGPVTEAAFQECFGFGYAAAEEKLRHYLPEAVDDSLRLVPTETVKLPPLNLRQASVLDIARIKGDWDRLEIPYVKAHYPELAPRYVAQARRTLKRAYDNGSRDPRLLAVMGLCECDAGNDVAARPYLEEAVRGGVVRPRANYELARLRYTEAKAKAALPDGRLSAAQADVVLEPLAKAYRAHPALLETYALTAEVWARSQRLLARHELDLLGEGVALFPWNAPLIYQTAWLNAQHGFTSEARALIDRGLKVTANAALVARFEQLRATLTTPPASTANPR